mmetsp:Transcript_136522/g.340440  ORF Transcript_136522/g.340440 Transcript_136522/m.340440 type:complete len:227 (+) Transcript_136522:337-1017(+)
MPLARSSLSFRKSKPPPQAASCRRCRSLLFWRSASRLARSCSNNCCRLRCAHSANSAFSLAFSSCSARSRAARSSAAACSRARRSSATAWRFASRRRCLATASSAASLARSASALPRNFASRRCKADGDSRQSSHPPPPQHSTAFHGSTQVSATMPAGAGAGPPRAIASQRGPPLNSSTQTSHKATPAMSMPPAIKSCVPQPCKPPTSTAPWPQRGGTTSLPAACN